MLANSFDFMPQKIYTEAERAIHIYYGFMTGDRAWELQVRSTLNLFSEANQ